MSKRKNSSRSAFLLAIFCSWWWTVASSTTTSSSSSNFEPYQLNGGLVTAVAGPDYLLVAADTRLMQGYQILTRHDTTRIRVIRNDNDDTTTPTISTPTSTPVHPNKVPWSNKDGTLNVDVDRVTSQRKTILETGTFTASSSSSILSILASAGCQADVQALHLQLRSQLRQGSAWSETSTCHNLLSQILYSRRGFPFYSFCVLAEWNNNNNNNIGGAATNHVACPKVFVYDAIGSYEQVAVATAGTGRELLQPILDQQFSSLIVLHNNPNDDSVVASSSSCGVVHASKEECMNIISRAYRSVAEREIGVGDALLILVIQRGKKKNHEDDPNFLLEWTLSCEPLKSH